MEKQCGEIGVDDDDAVVDKNNYNTGKSIVAVN